MKPHIESKAIIVMSYNPEAKGAQFNISFDGDDAKTIAKLAFVGFNGGFPSQLEQWLLNNKDNAEQAIELYHAMVDEQHNQEQTIRNMLTPPKTTDEPIICPTQMFITEKS
jgi:hypothetical protein